MKKLKRLLAALLVLAAGAVPVCAQSELTFCDFLIDAAQMDVLQEDIQIQHYTLDGTDQYQSGALAELTCALNRVTQDASFYIQPKDSGVSVTADYLTDLNGDGVYEQLEGREDSVWDELTPQIFTSSGRQSRSLVSGRTYILSAQALLEGGQQEVQARAELLGLDSQEIKSADSLCVINLRRASSDGTEQVLSYYLRLYGQVIMPTDVSPDAPYYSAVEYVLAQGYFAGIDGDTFQPDGSFTRAQLAQILWRLGGSLSATGCSFSDVDPDAWYYDAVSWCYQNGIMTGLSPNLFPPDTPLSQQQMALILYQYARHTGAPTQQTADLSSVAGGENVSIWARQGVEWALAYGLLPIPPDTELNPSADVTRGQMAMVLYTYDQAFVNR